MNSGLFLRSNGDLVCWDDVGVGRVLQRWDPQIDYAEDVFLGPVHDEIRKAFAAGRMPFKECRQGCLVLNAEQPFDPEHAQRRRVTYLQVESSFACPLKCPNCYPGQNRRNLLKQTTAGHMNLRTEVLEKLLTDFKKAQVDVQLIEFQGHGEPLVNRQIWAMITGSRRLYPEAAIRVITNANFPYREGMAEGGVSEMIFSIDGVDEASYTPYRVDGNFAKAFAFMKDFCTAVRASKAPVRTIWKYVLFDHNDRPEHLLTLRHLADEIGVDEVWLVVTQMGNASRRFLRSFLELEAKTVDDPQLASFAAQLAFQMPVADLHKQLQKTLGKSPLPMEALKGRSKMQVTGYLALGKQLVDAVHLAEETIARGAVQRAGDALVSFATRIWRLYDQRPELIIPAHAALIRRALAVAPHVDTEPQREVFLKLVTFRGHMPALRRKRPWGRLMPLVAVPAANVHSVASGVFESTGSDPQMALFGHELELPQGRCLLGFQAMVENGNLERPRLYVDTGAGFTEASSVALGRRSLRSGVYFVALPRHVKRLRLDPGDGVGTFRLTNVFAAELPDPVGGARRRLSRLRNRITQLVQQRL